MTRQPQPESEKPLSIWALIGLGLALATLLAAFLAGFGHQWGWWRFWIGFRILRYSLYGAFAAALASLLGLALSLWERAWRRAIWSLLGLSLSLTLIWIPLNLYYAAQGVPPIHDITTDTANPPAFVTILPLRRDAPNPAAYDGPRVARLQEAAYPHLKPRLFDAPFVRVFENARSAAHEMSWEIIATRPREGRIEATDITFWFGFRDDIVIRIRPEGNKTRLDIRSKSRVGRSDLGKNAARIEAFLKRMDGKLK